MLSDPIVYFMLGIVSFGVLLCLYYAVFSETPPPSKGNDDGGLPIQGDSLPRSDTPPTLTVNPSPDRRKDPEVSA